MYKIQLNNKTIEYKIEYDIRQMIRSQVLTILIRIFSRDGKTYNESEVGKNFKGRRNWQKS